MWLLVTFTLCGLALKIWSAHRLRQFWHVPAASVCFVFIAITYVQTILELYGYWVRHLDGEFDLVLFKLYFVLVIATAMYLPSVIDVVVLRRVNFLKATICIALWAMLSIIVFSTDWIIEGVRPLPQTYTRIPGSYYGFVPIVGLASIIYCVLHLLKIQRSSQNELVRTKACNILIGIAFLSITVLCITILMRLGVPINMAGVLPLSIGMLVFVLAEQFNDVRIFDLRTIVPFTHKWRRLWQQTRHIHTVSVDPAFCRGLVDEYTDSLIEAAEKVCGNQRDIANYVGVSQATVSRRSRKLDTPGNNHQPS